MHIPLVVFGHMHHRLQWRAGGGLRNMADIEASGVLSRLICCWSAASAFRIHRRSFAHMPGGACLAGPCSGRTR